MRYLRAAWQWVRRLFCRHDWAMMNLDGMRLLRRATEDNYELRVGCEKCRAYLGARVSKDDAMWLARGL